MEEQESKQDGILSKFSLNGKVAIVTGAGRGLGKGVALAFADVGADIIAVARTEEEIQKTAEEVHARGRKALAVKADVTDGKQVQNMVDQTLKHFGKIDVLMNNAGNPGIGRVPPLEMTEETWDKCLDSNLKSTFLCTKAVGRIMIDQGRGGSIINLSSVAAKGSVGAVAYSVAKAGIDAFTITMSQYLAQYKIRINAIAPGTVDSPSPFQTSNLGERVKDYAIPLMRLGRIEDIALAAIYLASDASDWVTGITLYVTGGAMAGSTLKMAEKQWSLLKKG